MTVATLCEDFMTASVILHFFFFLIQPCGVVIVLHFVIDEIFASKLYVGYSASGIGNKI